MSFYVVLTVLFVTTLNLWSCHHTCLHDRTAKLIWKIPKMKGFGVLFLICFYKLHQWCPNINVEDTYLIVAVLRLTLFLFLDTEWFPHYSHAVTSCHGSFRHFLDSYDRFIHYLLFIHLSPLESRVRYPREFK